MKYNNILVPTDFSEDSVKAYEFALDLASYHNSFLHLIHVVKPIINLSNPPYGFGKTEHEIFLNAEEKIRRFASIVPACGISIFETVRMGIPHEEILKFSKLKNIDLIVIARYGCTGLQGLNMGSVADKVVENSSVPVICVRTNDLFGLRNSTRLKTLRAENWIG